MANGRIKWREDTGPAENARLRLPKLAKEYFAEVRDVLAANPAPPELHRVRLASKQFRYTLELFRPCYAAGLEQRIQALKQLQDLLGECNDAVASISRVDAVLRRNRVERGRIRKFLEALAAEKAQAFRKHWVEVFDASGCENWWVRYLTRSARRPVKGK